METNNREAWEHLLSISEAMMAEPNFEQLLRRFAKILIHDFDVNAVGYFRYRQNGGEKVFEEVKVGSGHGLAPGVTTGLVLQLPMLVKKLGTEEFGLHHLSVGDQALSLVRLVEKNEPTFMVWTSATFTTSEQGLLEFLVRQLQNSARFFNQLGETQELLHRDDLTNLYNRRYLELSLESELRRVQRFNSQFCLLFIDLDNFKPINDQHGHLSGSEVLRQVADVLKTDLREVDSVFRYGGDEYVVMLLGASSSAGAMTAERIRKRLEDTRFRLDDGKEVRVTASIGVAACPEHGMSKSELLKIADQSMYRGKHEGKNRVFLARGSEAVKRDFHIK